MTLAELLFGIAALTACKRKDVLAQTLDGLMGFCSDRAVMAKNCGRGFPTPDSYIAAIAASRGFIVAWRDTAPYEVVSVSVINPWAV